MELLAHLVSADPASPRLTVYTESTGARMDFSAQTLDNWAAKVANFLAEELEIEPDQQIVVDLPVSWHCAVITLGGLARGADVHFGTDDAPAAEAIFTSPDRFSTVSAAHPGADIVLVTDDPFGRGVGETGGEVPPGAIDFGPTVRFYGDEYFETDRPLADIVAPLATAERLLSTGWTDRDSFDAAVLAPLAAGGSAVVVAGAQDEARLDDIARAEKVTARS